MTENPCLMRISRGTVAAIVTAFVAATMTSVSAFSPKTSTTRPSLALHATTPKFIRIVPRTARGSRQYFELQTAVTTFSRDDQQVDLHAQLHFADHHYYDYYNSQEFDEKYDRILYELILDESLLQQKNGVRYLEGESKNVLMASPTDQQTAKQYGLSCQVDVMDYARPNWIHADLTRQEILSETSAPRTQDNAITSQQPIWALASSTVVFPGAEALAALIRPSTPSTPLSVPVTRRLFSNLFLPGNALAAVLRGIFWLTLPSPELSVMVLDWSSLSPKPTGGVSPVALPVLQSLLSGNLQEARQLVFGQMLASGQGSSSNQELLILKRNEHALQVLTKCINDNQNAALLYGSHHCADLQDQLVDMGFAPTKTTWRTAWSVPIPNFGKGDSFVATPELAVGLVILPIYFAIGGLDWIGTLGDVAESTSNGNLLDASLLLSLYLVRHVFLYLGLAKFVVEWDGGMNLFGSNESR